MGLVQDIEAWQENARPHKEGIPDLSTLTELTAKLDINFEGDPKFAALYREAWTRLEADYILLSDDEPVTNLEVSKALDGILDLLYILEPEF
jgi:hypothetical protein